MRAETDGFKVRTLALYSRYLQSEILDTVFYNADATYAQIKSAPLEARPEIMFSCLRRLVEECEKLQRSAFDRLVRFLAVERINYTPEVNKRLEWATELIADTILGCSWLHSASGWIRDYITEVGPGNTAPAWLESFLDRAWQWLGNSDPQTADENWYIDIEPYREQLLKPKPGRLSQSRTDTLIVDFTKRLQMKLDFNRKKMIEEFLISPAEVPQRPEVNGKVGAAVSQSDRPAHLPEQHWRNDSSRRRAEEVARVLAELDVVTPRIKYENDYETVKKEFPQFAIFQVCDINPELKLKLENIQGHQQYVKFACEIVAAKYGRKFGTVLKDWKKHKPRKRGTAGTIPVATINNTTQP